MKLTLPAAYQPAFAVPAGVLPAGLSAVPPADALPPSGTGSRTIGAPVALAAALALAGCSAPSSLREYVPQIVTPHRIDIQQGNFVTQDMVDKLQAGQTRDQVRFILGTPLLTDIFHADRWDYVFRSAKGWNDPEKRRLTVFFDKTEKLAKWEAIAVPPPVDLAGGAGTAGANVTAATLPPVESPGLFGRLFGRAAGRTAGSTAASTSGTALPSRTDADAGATAGGAAAIAAAPSAAAPTAPVAPAPAPPPTSSAAAPAPAAQAPATPALVASPAGAVDGVGNLSLASNTAAATATAAAAVPVAPAASPQSVPVASGAATNEKPGMLGRMFRWMTPSPSVAPAVAAAPAAVPDPVAAAALAPVVAPQPPLPADLAPPVQRAAQAAPAIAAPSALAEPVAATVPVTVPAPAPPPAAVSATPAPSPVPAAAPAAAISPSLFTDLIEEWRAAWSAKKVEAYIALYAPDFKPPGMTRALWEAQRKERLTKPIFIFVNLSAPQITMSGDNTATAVFTQTYESDTLKQVGRKTLVFGNINGKWLIRDESFKAQ